MAILDKIQKRYGFTRRLVMAAALLCAAPFGNVAFADDDDDDVGAPAISYPFLKGEIEIELQSDNTFRADDDLNEIGVSSAEITTELEFRFNRMFAVYSTLVVEQTVEPEIDGKDQHFERHGLFAEQLYGQFDLDRLKIFGGKFNVNYGKAWDLAPGIYGSDFAEDGYEFTERLGFGAGLSRDGGGLGEVTVTAAVFRADTSTLSNSAFNNRGQTGVNDGGFGNTESLENFAIAVDGEKIPSLPGVSYHVGYIHQGKGRIGDDIDDPDDFALLDDQNGFVFGLYGEREYNNVKFEWLGELSYFDNYIIEDDDAVKNIYFLTLGGKVEVNKFNVALAYTYRPYELVDGDEFEDHLATVSAGYELRDDLLLEVGYRYQTNEEEDDHTVGVKLTKEIEFNTAK